MATVVARMTALGVERETCFNCKTKFTRGVVMAAIEDMMASLLVGGARLVLQIGKPQELRVYNPKG